MTTAAKLFANAKNAAGDHAVQAARDGNYTKSREWAQLAVEADLLLRRSVELMAQ